MHCSSALPRIVALSKETSRVRFLGIQVPHGPGMMVLNTEEGKGGKGKSPATSATDLAMKHQVDLTESLMKYAGGRLTYVLDTLDTSTPSSPHGKITDAYGANLSTWVLLDKERHVLATGSESAELKTALQKT